MSTISIKGIKYGSSLVTASVEVDNAPEYNQFSNCVVMVVPEHPITSLALNPETLSLHQNDNSCQIDAKIKPDDASYTVLQWVSSDDRVATVNQNGVVTPISTGTCTITATTLDGSDLSATSQITITAPTVKTISISPSKLTIADGASETLTAEYTPSDAEAQLTWTVDNVAVIGLIQTVDGMNATLTALKPGTATVTLTESISGLETTCTVTVVEVPVTALNLNIEDATIDIQDGPLMLSVTINPAEATVPALVWKSSDKNVATVTNTLGLQAQINPLLAGTAVITVSHADNPTISDNCTITVTDKSSLGEVFTDGTFSGPVDVYDLSGRLVRRQATESDLQDLRSGIYIFRQGTTSRKILIQ